MISEVLSRIATVVIVGEPERLKEGAAALERSGDAAAVRAILISNGDDPAPAIRHEEHTIVVERLHPRFLNNAVAALRLSSLPTLVWWRGGDPERLAGLAALAERVVLDAPDPQPAWAHAAPLLERSAFSDLRWTTLTRWRALMANFFDMPEVRAGTFTSLAIAGSDPHTARLFAGWIQASLGRGGHVSFEHEPIAGAPVRSIRLGGDRQDLVLQLAASGSCVEAAARRDDRGDSWRTVSLGDQALPALITEELRVRARDHAFERALTAALSIGDRQPAP